MIPVVSSRLGTKTITNFTGPTTATNVAPSGGRMSVTIFNNGAQTLFLGPTNAVTTSTGYPVLVGTSFTDSVSSDDWWAIPASGTLDVRVITVS